MCYQLVVSMTN